MCRPKHPGRLQPVSFLWTVRCLGLHQTCAGKGAERKGGAARLSLLADKQVCVYVSACLCVCASPCFVCVRACSICRILESVGGSRMDEGRQSEAMSAYQPSERAHTHMAVLHKAAATRKIAKVNH